VAVRWRQIDRKQLTIEKLLTEKRDERDVNYLCIAFTQRANRGIWIRNNGQGKICTY